MSTPGPGRRRSHGLGVDVSAAFNLVGDLVKYFGLASLVPIAFALGNGEKFWPFLLAGVLISGGGYALTLVTRGADQVGIREGYLVISLVWLVAGVYGALPFFLAGDPQLGRPVDALFEGMSGFTTTGSSTATDVAALPTSMQIWRQLTLFLGGIGVVALALAVLPRLRVGGRQIVESELAGSETQALSGRIRDTVQRFSRLYVAIGCACFLALALPGWLGLERTMDTFQAFAHALSTVGSGGFSTEPRSIGAFGGLTQWTVIVFMAIAGLNFLLLYRAVFQRRLREALRDEELRAFFVVLALASAVVATVLLLDGQLAGEEAIRAATFQVTSVITTTGYVTVDYAQWPLFALMALALLFFVGGCAGSTTGSIKIVRHLVLARLLSREISRTVQPELIKPVRLGGVVVDQSTQLAVISFVLIYIAVFVAATAVLAVESAISGPEFDALGLIYASASSLGNSGMGLGEAGPTGSFAPFGDVSTVTMTVLMWVGRLEILPVIVLLRASYWRA